MISLQGTPLKLEPAGSSKRHDVRSIISSSPRPYSGLPPHLERGHYDEPGPKSRPSAVVSTSSSLVLGAEQASKSHHSPVGYDEHKRAGYAAPSHRGSPLTSRDAPQRPHEGTQHCTCAKTPCYTVVMQK